MTKICPICGHECECDEGGAFECDVCDYEDEGDWI